jgi:hypothetical protein
VKTARDLIVSMIAGDGSGTSLHNLADKVAGEILDKHVDELSARINVYSRDIGPDQFSHQEDAYYAGLRDAVRILKGDLDEFE